VGASSGIGAELARELARRGAHVAVSARRPRELAAVAGATMSGVPVDVTDRESVDHGADTVRAALGGLDCMVYTAGYWKQFDAASWDRDVFARHVEVNLLGLDNVLGAVVPGLVTQGSGHVVVVASVAGYRGLAGSEAYGATKAAQLNLLEAMRISLSPRGVRVSTVAPGFVRTPMTDANDFPMPFLVDADVAAREIADGIEAGRDDITFPLPMALTMKAARLVPGRVWTALSSRGARGARRASTGAPSRTPSGRRPGS
jgi:NAD(P)-dependent dehydrogenase (short-subunit alcohol dehydrogenase family)